MIPPEVINAIMESRVEGPHEPIHTTAEFMSLADEQEYIGFTRKDDDFLDMIFTSAGEHTVQLCKDDWQGGVWSMTDEELDCLCKGWLLWRAHRHQGQNLK